MNRHQLFSLLIVIGCSGCLTSTAKAQCFGNGYGTGYFDAGRLYQQLRIAHVPYFSAFPPVYYSTPVPRTYGYSPFAYLPHVQTPEVVESIQPQEIVNPHVPASVKDASASQKKEDQDLTTQASRKVEPLLVINPYVTQSLNSKNMALARTLKRRPLSQ
jgi:hypothetical protein